MFFSFSYKIELYFYVYLKHTKYIKKFHILLIFSFINFPIILYVTYIFCVCYLLALLFNLIFIILYINFYEYFLVFEYIFLEMTQILLLTRFRYYFNTFFCIFTLLISLLH